MTSLVGKFVEPPLELVVCHASRCRHSQIIVVVPRLSNVSEPQLCTLCLVCLFNPTWHRDTSLKSPSTYAQYSITNTQVNAELS